MTCMTVVPAGICTRYCCDDGDCGPMGTCDKMIFAPYGVTNVGLCVSSDGSGGGGVGGGGPVPCVDVPVIAPSNGACVTVQ
ncbi:hypothetical protein JYT28_00075 [Desulfobulbus sp. AH-315-M07]|nr:hypothetical protein [Desulfobulbus sp. AH-315-M07]